MTTTTRRPRVGAAFGVTTGLLLMAACAGGVQTSLAATKPNIAVSGSTGFRIDKHALLFPSHKYYGISLAGVPQSLGPIATVKKQTHKQPNLAMYYLSWGPGASSGQPNFNALDAMNACKDGLLPMMTWESWDTNKTTAGQGVSYDQPAFKMTNITNGEYDAYIRKTAQAVASMGCPIALRFDQEANGYWYPWGISNIPENGSDYAKTAHQYLVMFRHVERIFNAAGATNVLWVWSPNIQKTKTKLPSLAASYPGNNWVDWVGIDGYFNGSTLTFSTVFGPTFLQLATVTPTKPWIIAETGVGRSANKPTQITNLLNAVARNKHLNGMVYFDQHKSSDRSFWPFVDPAYPKSLPAFKAGIAQSAYAAGKPGSLT